MAPCWGLNYALPGAEPNGIIDIDHVIHTAAPQDDSPLPYDLISLGHALATAKGYLLTQFASRPDPPYVDFVVASKDYRALEVARAAGCSPSFVLGAEWYTQMQHAQGTDFEWVPMAKYNMYALAPPMDAVTFIDDVKHWRPIELCNRPLSRGVPRPVEDTMKSSDNAV